MEEDQPVLKMQIGGVLQLQIAGDERKKYVAKSIGFLKDGSVITTMPRVDGKPLIMREGQPLVVRMMSGTNLYAFNTSVLLTSMRPYAHMHLAYPRSFESIAVRKAMRVSTRLDINVTHVDLDAPDTTLVSKAAITDLSTTGALVECDIQLANKEDILTINAKLPVAGVDRSLNLNGIVRSVKSRTDETDGLPVYQHGVEFELLEEMDAILLHGYVYEQLHQHES